MVSIKTKVTCPKCGQSFEYEFVPGGSFTSIRLGPYRYMRCQKCGKWALFNITENLSQSQIHNLSNSSIIAGIALVIFGIAILMVALARHIVALDITGIKVLVLAFFMAVSSVARRKGLNEGK